MKILITGGAGFVGSTLVKKELDLGHDVIVTDTSEGALKPLLAEHSNLSFYQTDINDPKMENYVSDSDLVFHMAAICNPKDYCIRPHEVLDVNILGTRNIANYCMKHNKKIVFSSSSEIYGKNSNVPWKEEDFSVMQTNQSRWCYSTSKIAGEHYIRALALQGLKYGMGRFFNFYGPNLRGRVIYYFLQQFVKGDDVLVVAPGDQTRCFTYIEDAVHGFWKVGHMPEAENQVFNIGDNREISIWELASIMKKVGEFKSKIKVVNQNEVYEAGYDDIPRRVPDTTKIRECLNWKPSYTLEEGLAKTIEHFVKHN